MSVYGIFMSRYKLLLLLLQEILFGTLFYDVVNASLVKKKQKFTHNQDDDKHGHCDIFLEMSQCHNPTTTSRSGVI